MYALNSMRSLSDVENEALYRSFTGADLLLRFIRLANTENVFYMSQNHRILIEWEIFEMNSSEFNEPWHEIHQNPNSDNCHQETNCWDWLKSFVVTDHRRKRNQRIICYVAGHAVALLYCVNKPAVVREQFVKIVTGLPGVPVTEELNFFENEYSKESIVSTDFDIFTKHVIFFFRFL